MDGTTAGTPSIPGPAIAAAPTTMAEPTDDVSFTDLTLPVFGTVATPSRAGLPTIERALP